MDGVAGGLSIAGAADAALDHAAGQALMDRNSCSACHEIDKKLIGPACKDVAGRYNGDKGSWGAAAGARG